MAPCTRSGSRAPLLVIGTSLRRFASLVILIAATAAGGPFYGQAESVPTSATATSARYSARFLREVPTESFRGKVNFVIEIVDRKDGSTREVLLDRPCFPIAESSVKFHWAGDETVIVEVRWNGRPDSAIFLFVIDAAEAQVTDTIRCRNPKSSPTKRYWVYEKYVQSHAPLWVFTSVILCYDIHKSPRENRMDPDARFPSDDEVGWAVYPPPFVAEHAYFLPEQQLARRAGWYNLLSPFLWAEDADKVYFLCQEWGYPTALVSVDLSRGSEQPLSDHIALTSETEKIRPFTTKSNFPYLRDNWVPAILAGELSWHDKTHITIHTHSVYNPRAPNEFIVEIPQGGPAE